MKRLLFLLALGCQAEYDIINSNGDMEIYYYNPQDLDHRVVTDTFVQITYPMVDILWVIDNSGSMSDDQAKLVANFPVFMDYLIAANIDYHIGVTTTDPHEEGLLRSYRDQRWIDPSEPNPQAAFSALASVGAMGWGTECGKLAVWNAVNNNNNIGFMRADAGFYVMIITDENDSSDIEGERDTIRFGNWFNNIKRDETKSSFSGIIPIPPGYCTWGQDGTGYHRPIRVTQGIQYDICEEDWSPALRALGLQSAGYKTTFNLSHQPVENTIIVRVVDNGITYELSWEYLQEENSIFFAEIVPPAHSEIVITYVVLE